MNSLSALLLGSWISPHSIYHELETSPYEVPHEVQEDLYGEISSNDIQAIDSGNIKLVYELQVFFVEVYIIFINIIH